MEQGVAAALERDGDDAHCTHVLAMDGADPVGAARFQYIEDYAKLQRICVPAPARRRGIGTALVKFMLTDIKREERARSVRLGAQTHALAFYEALGFCAFGPEFLDADIPHRMMKMQLD